MSTTKYYINFHPETGVSVNIYRQPVGVASADIAGLVEDYRKNRAGCCPLEGAMEALEDGSLWSDDQQDAVEDIHHDVDVALGAIQAQRPAAEIYPGDY